MSKLKEKIASLFIPKNTPYCHFNFIKTNYGYRAKACPFWKWKYNKEYECKMEYCTYLNEFLDIQDQVKDCGINDWNGEDDNKERIIKDGRPRWNMDYYKEHITEEFADVMVMLCQIKYYYGLNKDKITKIMNYKIDRQLKRIEEEKSESEVN